MKKRALWIFDDNYAMLTYLSISSFVEHCDVIPTLIYCGTEMKEDDRNIFLALDPKVEIYYFSVDVSQWKPHFQANILNRLARIHFTRLFENDLLFMIDSDVGFSPSLKYEFQEIENVFESESGQIPMIAGVVEFLRATDAFLYFKKKDKKGIMRKMTEEAKIASFKSIYGDEWETLVNSFQLNNGFLIFYKARPLIDLWETYYLAGLNNPEINPLDDQVPLSAAMQKIKCDYWKMDNKWNSLGGLDGAFIMFHAWAGEWKVEIDQVLRNQKSTSDYGEICKRYLHNWTQGWIDKFNKDLKSFPYKYRQIQGGFDHGSVFTDLIDELDEGHIVEVGTYKGRSACFVAELIQSHGKNITFETIDHYKRSDTNLDFVQSNLSRAGLDSFVTVIEAESIKAAEFYDEKQLDFVILDTDSPPDALANELEVWYDKIKEGGVLAGYDHSIHDTVFKNYDCATASFCEKYSIPLRTYEYQFLIKKPFKTIDK